MVMPFFITGTDTNVGKTVIAAVLKLALDIPYWKPIQSGADGEITDSIRIQQLTSCRPESIFPSSYRFKAALSPDQAAALENVKIDLHQCLLPTKGSLIIEGAGGVLVPLNQEHCVIDMMHVFQVPIVIVARGTLGTINHTLLTIQALKQKNLLIKGIIFTGHLNKDNQHAIEKWGQVKTLFHLPYFETVNYHSLHSWSSENRHMILEAFL